MKPLEEDPIFAQSFAKVGCLRFCQKLQGFHAQITMEFTLNFTGTGTNFKSWENLLMLCKLLHQLKICLGSSNLSSYARGLCVKFYVFYVSDL